MCPEAKSKKENREKNSEEIVLNIPKEFDAPRDPQLD